MDHYIHYGCVDIHWTWNHGDKMGVSQKLGIPPHTPPRNKSDILMEKMMKRWCHGHVSPEMETGKLTIFRHVEGQHDDKLWVWVTPPKKKRMIIGCPDSNCFGQSHVCYGHQSQCPYRDLGTLCGDQHVVSTGIILAPDSPSRVRGGPSKVSWSVTRWSRIYDLSG